MFSNSRMFPGQWYRSNFLNAGALTPVMFFLYFFEKRLLVFSQNRSASLFAFLSSEDCAEAADAEKGR